MKLYVWMCAALLLAACRTKPKTTAVKDSIPTPAGYYESSDSTRLIALTLRRGGDVEMLTDSLNNTPEKIQIGNWRMPDSTGQQIEFALITVGNDPSRRDTSLLQIQPDSSLVASGTVFNKKPRPVPAEKVFIFRIKNEQQCERGPGFAKLPCYDVQYADGRAWERFHGPIDSFKYEEGFIYRLKVRRIPRDSAVQQIGGYHYKLAEILEKVAE